MSQLTMFESGVCMPVVNVASVPKRSPFRYPGGKTWLVPHVRRWLRCLSFHPGRLVEPFAGGGIISLTAAFEKLADSVLMVEIDDDIAAVWEAVTSTENEVLARMILTFDMEAENVIRELSTPVTDRTTQAFHTILRNRVHHGGIMAGGSGMIKKGENGKGIGSRWYPRTLSNRIRDIASVADRIEFIRDDGISQIRNHRDRADTVFFVDPPYTAGGKRAGRRLYNYNELDHESLFAEMALVQGDFLMTYDYSDEIIVLAERYGFSIESVAMKNTHHARMRELLIGRNLSWMHRS